MEMDEPLIDTLIEFNEHKWRRNHLTSEQSRFGNEQLIEADSVCYLLWVSVYQCTDWPNVFKVNSTEPWDAISEMPKAQVIVSKV